MDDVRNVMRRVVLGSMTVIALLLSGCGGGDSAPTTSGGEGAETAALTKDNIAQVVSAAQLEAGSVRMTTVSSLGGQELTGEGALVFDADGGSVRMEMTMNLPGVGEVSTKLIGEDLYSSNPADPGTWIKMSLADLADLAGQDMTAFDPNTQLERWQDSITVFEQSGDPIEIDGTPATPYEIVIEMDEAAADSELGELNATMWIGQDDLIRRMELDMEGNLIRVDYTDWGADITIEAPAESDVVSPDQLGGGLG